MNMDKHTQTTIAILVLTVAIGLGGYAIHELRTQVQEVKNAAEFSYEEQLNALSASLAISEPVPLFEDALASGISNSATSFTLIRGTDKTNTNLASSTYGFILSEGSANEEFVLADCTATACTNVVRGYWPLTGATSSALMKTHRRGDTVKITDSPIINQLKRIINGQDEFPYAVTFGGALTLDAVATYSSALSFTPGSNQIVTALYADNIAAQGAATSSESVGGIVELATYTEQASSTDLGVNRPLVLQAKNASSTPTRGCDGTATAGKLCAVIAGLTGKIAQVYLDLTENFTWTGLHTFSSGVKTTECTLTDGATVTMNLNTCVQGKVVLAGNRTMTFSNESDGQAFRIVVCSDASARQISTWDSNVLWPGGTTTPPTPTATANRCDVYSFVTSAATSTTRIFGAIVPF